MRRDYFKFGEVNSLDYGLWFLNPHTEITPERDVEFTKIPGRSGELLSDETRWKNVDIPYEVAITTDFINNYRNLAAALLSQSGYRKLENSFDPNEYRMATIVESMEAETTPYHRAGRFEIVFHCKPQRYLKTGDTAVVFMSAGTLTNPTGFKALPIIRVYGNGAGTVSVGGVTVTIKNMTDSIVLDCENMNAYNNDGNQNLNIIAPTFPVLNAGDSGIAFTGGVTKVEIVPRWWRL